MIEPFLSAVPVLKMLEDAGFEAYFVGGSVRDFLLKKKISDVDIATSATPEEVKKIFSKTVDIGIEHGTVLVLFQNDSYEMTTFRMESEYQDFRRPKEVSFVRSLEQDLERRDFTMNAIAMDRNGRLIDPFGGQSAIKKKMIETVGSAHERFQEDALRMMRAVRFVSQLSFEIEPKTVGALTDLAPLLKNIAVERKRAEFEKLMAGENRRQAFNLLLSTELYLYLPSLDKQKENIKRLQSIDLDGLDKNEMWSLLLYFFHLKDKQIEHFLREWRLSLKEIRDIQKVLSFLNKRFAGQWPLYELYLAGPDTILSVEKLYQALKGLKDYQSISGNLEQYDALPMKDRSEMKVTGNDLINWFNQKGGPWVKESLTKIEKAIVEGKVTNNPNKIKEWLMECNQK